MKRPGVSGNMMPNKKRLQNHLHEPYQNRMERDDESPISMIYTIKLEAIPADNTGQLNQYDLNLYYDERPIIRISSEPHGPVLDYVYDNLGKALYDAIFDCVYQAIQHKDIAEGGKRGSEATKLYAKYHHEELKEKKKRMSAPRKGRRGAFRSKEEFLVALKEVLSTFKRRPSKAQVWERLMRHQACNQVVGIKSFDYWLALCGFERWEHARHALWGSVNKGK